MWNAPNTCWYVHPKWLGKICSRKTPVQKSVASAMAFSFPVRKGPEEEGRVVGCVVGCRVALG